MPPRCPFLGGRIGALVITVVLRGTAHPERGPTNAPEPPPARRKCFAVVRGGVPG